MWSALYSCPILMQIRPVEAELFHANVQTWRSLVAFTQFWERVQKN